ncbi:hypothetical protein A9K55_007913 [Cordyceps militaris]|uniref:Uncharacterized protein n=1 Tax=Cordyceps militaris TaxID=73501 RepID=A0A2H4SFI9_CORMI|nr:hypothetical protein A9K55_007913 [Cordyceps militaris]
MVAPREYGQASASALPDPLSVKTSPFTIYITLQFLRVIGEENYYHWGIFVTQQSNTANHLFHATDMGRRPLDLYPEVRIVSDPLKSKTMTCCLKVARAPSLESIKAVASTVRLMDPRYLPRNEPLWTCRVWVKEVLASLEANGLTQLPVSVDRIQAYGVETADLLRDQGISRLINDLSWISSPTVPMQVDPRPRHFGQSPMNTEVVERGAYYLASPRVPEGYRRERLMEPRRGEYYGRSPMDTEVHPPRQRVVQARQEPYYGPSPMDTETHPPPRGRVLQARQGPYYGPKPMETETHSPRGRVLQARQGPYYGPKPMETETHSPRGRVLQARQGPYYGPKPMETETHPPRSRDMQARQEPYYGPKPMDTDVGPEPRQRAQAPEPHFRYVVRR